MKKQMLNRSVKFTYKNVKGFTLIELLAVIVILAIISLIAAPIILGIIEDSKRKAFKESVNFTFDAYKYYVTGEKSKGNLEFETDIDVSKLPLENKEKLSGKIIQNKDGEIVAQNVTNGEYCASGTKNSLTIVKGDCEKLGELLFDVKAHINKATMNSITVTVEDIDGVSTSYIYKINNETPISSNDRTYTFNNLNPDTNYKITIISKNKKGKEITRELNAKTLPVEITYTLSNELEYEQRKTLTIIYPELEGTTLQYKQGDGEFITTTNNPLVLNLTSNTTVVAKILKGEEVVASKVITVNTIDNTKPIIKQVKVLDNAKIQVIAEDKESGIKEYSIDNGKTWQTSNEFNYITGEWKNIQVKNNVGLVSDNSEYCSASTLDTTPNKPVLGSLTPVVYENETWKVVNENSKWYDYSNQEWANAVLLKSGVSKSVGDTVNVEDGGDIQGMFVWIPRYEYKIAGQYGACGKSAKLPGEIEVKFVKNQTGQTYKNNETEYGVHPAFKFGDKELDGIWMGKFETTGTEDNPTILPNVTSLRYQNVSTQFATSQKFQIKGYDSHMAKNSEWGAVAYLSQSKYGKYGNPNYSGVEKQVRINNCSSFITGIGANSQNESSSSSICTSSSNTYTSSNGQAASTTGNITGIYDMSGGAWDAVMGVYNETIRYSGFSSFENIELKYYDNYTATTSTTACSSKICYGHALSETAGWYSDTSTFVSSSSPWLYRSGAYYNGSSAGVLNFEGDSGNSRNNFSFHVVLAQN